MLASTVANDADGISQSGGKLEQQRSWSNNEGKLGADESAIIAKI
jgi:hypothetical protein